MSSKESKKNRKTQEQVKDADEHPSESSGTAMRRETEADTDPAHNEHPAQADTAQAAAGQKRSSKRPSEPEEADTVDYEGMESSDSSEEEVERPTTKKPSRAEPGPRSSLSTMNRSITKVGAHLNVL